MDRYLSVKAPGELTSLVPAIRRITSELDPDVPLYRIRTLESVIEGRLAVNRTVRELFLTFGVLTLLLGALGIYSVVSYATATRGREIGLRLALGAEPGRMTRLVALEGLAAIAIGVAIGLVASAVLGRALGSFLFEVDPLDPAILALATVTLLGVGWLAAWLPARSASRVAPATVLRRE